MSDKRIQGYKIISLSEMLSQVGGERVKEILSSFSSPKNKDVETFLKEKAITFDEQSISKTHLVFASYRGEVVLVGYFTLAYKEFTIPIKNIGCKLKGRLKKFGNFIFDLKAYKISAPLIAQLSKNFANGYNRLISGDELLQMACDMISGIQSLVGGKIVYVECEDKICLTDFYERNGFVIFSQRQLDAKSKENMDTDYLLQLLRYL